MNEFIVQEFWLVIIKYFQIVDFSIMDEQLILQELKSLKTKEKDKDHIEQKFNDKKKTSIFMAIVYLYSTDILFREFNQVLAQRKYVNLLNTLAISLHGFDDKDLKEKSNFKGSVLFRGIENKENACDNIRERFPKGEKKKLP